MGLDADVEPDRAVKRELLLDEQMAQIVSEILGIIGTCKISVPFPSGGNRMHPPTNHLADAGFSLRGPERTTEILRDNNVGREL